MIDEYLYINEVAYDFSPKIVNGVLFSLVRIERDYNFNSTVVFVYENVIKDTHSVKPEATNAWNYNFLLDGDGIHLEGISFHDRLPSLLCADCRITKYKFEKLTISLRVAGYLISIWELYNVEIKHQIANWYNVTYDHIKHLPIDPNTFAIKPNFALIGDSIYGIFPCRKSSPLKTTFIMDVARTSTRAKHVLRDRFTEDYTRFFMLGYKLKNNGFDLKEIKKFL